MPKPLLLFILITIPLSATAQSEENPFLTMTHRQYLDFIILFERNNSIEFGDSTEVAATLQQLYEAAQATGDKKWELEARFFAFQMGYFKALDRIKIDGKAEEKVVDELKRIGSLAKRAKCPDLQLRVEYFIFWHYWHKIENHEKAFLQWNILEKLLSQLSAEDFPPKLYYFTQIATLHAYFDQYEKAIYYFKKVLETPQLAFAEGHWEWVTNELGIIYRSVNYRDFERSDSCFHTILASVPDSISFLGYPNFTEVQERIELWQAIAKGNLAGNLKLQGKEDEAIPLLIESMEGVVKNNTYNYPYAAAKAIELSNIYLQKNNLPEVWRYAGKTLEWLNVERHVSRSHNISLWRSYYRVMLHYYRAVGDNASAWIYNDSLDYVRRIVDEELNLQQVHNAEQQIIQEDLKAEQMRSLAYRRNLIIAAVFTTIVLILLLLIIRHNRMIAKKNIVIVRQTQALQKEFEETKRKLLSQTHFEQERDNTDASFSDARYNQLCENLRNLILIDKVYLTTTLTRDELAKQLGINIKLLSSLFLSCFGTSYHETIHSLRLNDAVILLQQTNDTILTISEKTGFGTIRSFQRQFQNKYKMSPVEYRNSSLSLQRQEGKPLIIQ